jgi:hypothetical protein
MADAPNLAKLVPGFDFLQQLAQGASSAMPGIGQWIAPTLDPKEIDKRIEELRTVQFWLEQNARLLGTTIQALEVQRMTLSTLQTMNVQMEDLRDSLTIRTPPNATRAKAASAPSAATPAPAPAQAAVTAEATPPAAPAAAAGAPAAAGAVVDPMQWWGALTRQFTELAGSALRDGVGAATAAGVAATGSARKAVKAASSPSPATKKRRAKAAPRGDARKQPG